jgi:hypothetical protein
VPCALEATLLGACRADWVTHPNVELPRRNMQHVHADASFPSLRWGVRPTLNPAYLRLLSHVYIGPAPCLQPTCASLLSLSLPSVPRLLSQILFPMDKRDMPVVILLLGPTGSGKSTFVNHVAKQQARTGVAGDAKPCPFTPQDISHQLILR